MTSAPTPSTLLIDLADLPSLACAATLASRERAAAWHPEGWSLPADDHLALVLLHERQFTLRETIVRQSLAAPARPDDRFPELADGLDLAPMLIAACRDARRIGCSRVVAPLYAAGDLDRATSLIELATTVIDLVDQSEDLLGEAGLPPGSLAIDLPVVDLDDVELVDLAEDAGAPMASFHPAGPVPALGGAQMARWRRAFEARRLAWPFADEPVHA